MSDTQLKMLPCGQAYGEITRHKNHVKEFHVPTENLASQLLNSYIEITLEAEVPIQATEKVRVQETASDDVLGCIEALYI